MSDEPRKYGLRLVYQVPPGSQHNVNDIVDIVAIHGLDTQSPRTWIAWRIDGDCSSGDVHWLKDTSMLPSVIPNSRIFTYDWNANLDRIPGAQFLLGHANDLLSKLYMERLRDGNDRPIIFVASCFGGLLLAQALYRSSEAGNKFQGILKSTAGVAFLGTPFQGSNRGFLSAVHLRVTVAISMGGEASGNLIHYLDNGVNEQLDGLVQVFSEMNRKNRFNIVCFYETLPMDFTAFIKKLPKSFVDYLEGDKVGVLVDERSACLQGHPRHGLNVRHSMLCKYASPDNDDFKAVSSHLKEFTDIARQQRQDKMSLRDDPYGLQIAEWLLRYLPSESQHLDVTAFVYQARELKKLEDSGQDGVSILAKFSRSVQSSVGQSLRRLASVVNYAALYATSRDSVIEQEASRVAGKVIQDMKESMADVRAQTQDALLLEPDIMDILGEAMAEQVTAVVGAHPSLDLRQNVLQGESMLEADELEIQQDSIESSLPDAALHRFHYAAFQGKTIAVERIPYRTEDGLSDVPARDVGRIVRLVARLSHPERTSHYVLRCAGFVRYRYEQQMGLLFHLEGDYDMASTPVTLQDIYSDNVGKTRQTRVPLGLRFKLAHSLASAVEGLHRVGWVHKDIQSKHVVFFPSVTDATRGSVSGVAGLGSPCLFGFELSRPEEEETDLTSDYSLKSNAYRHPERWGKPRVKFTKAHDIYSLGVIFIELACWKSIFGLKFKNLETTRCESEDLRREMLKLARGDIPHLMGQSFATVIETCLTFAENPDEYQNHEVFKEKVVGVLQRLAATEI